ncbi:DNA-binding transcriptional LysR family regulator [Pseudorhizobium tarimense]|uniref:DNA-binding transcriptional LysR family regulator n=1 Tax=Pseudorhizobium tarimense TaxID=1079109 RepID=A0ABV2H3H1_9HYPH|nr:LysR substrate-binding domain-containing protein [Pseudorhizobium tarimense]MCJ8518497.1 LysR substrate-binding domain-containing protein [Pseudorhizobium tarimense]
MDTAWLLDLQVLAKTLNFSRAAEIRNITQPAFGRRIKSLEAWCGSTLIDRSSHRLALTEAGKVMVEAADDVIRRLERSKHELQQLRSSTATLTVASTHALSYTFFPGWVQGLGSLASTMPIRLLSDNMNECERLMLAGEAHFLLCHHHPGTATRLSEREFPMLTLSHERLVPVSRRDNEGQAIYRLPGSPARPVPWLMFEGTSGMGRILVSALSQRTEELHLHNVFSSHLAMVLMALALEGKGVAWIPESLAADELSPGGGLAIAGPMDWAVPVQVALFRTVRPLPDMAERFWQLARNQSLGQVSSVAGPVSAP